MTLDVIVEDFILQKRKLMPRTLELLRDLYPTIDWSRVDFYEGLPWFTQWFAPYVTAQALPDFYSTHRYCIYLKRFDERRVQCLADIVHEAFHVLQAMHFKNGRGVGFFRAWTFYYLAYFFKVGYRDNPFEIPAYDQEYRFLDHCAREGLHGVEPAADDCSLRRVSTHSALRFTELSFRYTGKFPFLVLSFLACSAITIARPVVDAVIWTIRLFSKKAPASSYQNYIS